MVEHTDEDLGGSRFERVDLRGATFEQVDLGGAFVRNSSLTGARLRGVWLEDVDVDGEVRGLRVNGVDVGPLVEAELDRRHPERRLLGLRDAQETREAWAAVTAAWGPVVARARALPPAMLDERVDTEWSFIETLRHLVFGVDAWLLRALLGDPHPYSALGLPHDEMGGDTPVPRDLGARPTLDEVLGVRAERVSAVSRYLEGLTDEQLEGTTAPVLEPGYPETASYPVRRCLRAVVWEAHLHRQFVERDLEVLEARAKSGG